MKKDKLAVYSPFDAVFVDLAKVFYSIAWRFSLNLFSSIPRHYKHRAGRAEASQYVKHKVIREQSFKTIDE